MRNFHKDKLAADPLRFGRMLWPDVRFYRQQRDVIYSAADNDETFVPAGHMLGKDFVAAFTSLWFFLTRHPCRVLTTSADGPQLEGVLWGEIRRFIQTSKYPLEHHKGGPLVVNHLNIRKIIDPKTREVCGLSYLKGRVAAKGEGMQGHHVAETGDGLARTLYVADEASGVDDLSYNAAETWARRKLVIGNPYPCNNFFKRGVLGGDLAAPPEERPDGSTAPSGRMYRKVVRIRAEDSPNVRLAFAERVAGKRITGRVLLPGVLPYADFVKRRRTWDRVKQCVGMDGCFYEGAEVLLYPPVWLNRAEGWHAELMTTRRRRRALAVGIDPAEGGDRTAMSAVDRWGLIEQVSMRTRDTSVIREEAIAFGRKHGVPPHAWVFDRGGGGTQIAHQLRADGYEGVRTVGFGTSPTSGPRQGKGIRLLEDAVNEEEERYTYVNRRAEMYGELRLLLDPSTRWNRGRGFALPPEYTRLRHQLALIPFKHDREGRLRLPPKYKTSENSTEITLVEIVGHSPDEADSLVLAVHGMLHPSEPALAGAI